MTIAEVRKRFEAESIRRVKVGAIDIDGVLRGKHISLEKFFSAAEEGFGFCDVIFGWDIADALYDNVQCTGWHTGYPDAVARIDLASYRLIPWEPGTAFFLLDLEDKSGQPHPASPRQLMRRVLHQVDNLGYSTCLAAEYEFWCFSETPQSLREKRFRNLSSLTPGMFGYSVLRASENAGLVLDLLEHLAGFDTALEGLHTETGPGVYEAAIRMDTGLAAADKAALFKTAVKEIAARHSVIPTFMAKWNAELPGSSGHIHQSLWDAERRQNLFHGSAEEPFPPAMRHYIAGLVQNMPDLMVMFCPTVNSYKRTVPGTWAPINATWGVDSRTTAVRAIAGAKKSARVELRLCGADINPYLAMAASLAAGLDGIERQLEPPEPVSNAYDSSSAAPLPRTLSEAVHAFRHSALARSWFGEAFVEHCAATREWEVRQYERAVTDWELARYFEAI